MRIVAPIIFFTVLAFSITSQALVQPLFSPYGGFMDKMVEIISAPSVKTIDISIYSFGSSTKDKILKALKNAKKVNPAIEIRVVMDRGNAKAKPQIVEEMESFGADVRTVTKTNHNKFIVINGIHCKVIHGDTCVEDPSQTKILTGSGNFNSSAQHRQDEVFTYVEENESLAKHYSLEFAWLWNHSKDLGVELIPNKLDTAEGTVISEDYRSQAYAVFTHDNYIAKGTRFSKKKTKVVADTIIKLIRNAKSSIKIAHTYFKMKDVALALHEKSRDPDVNIYIYLDGKNYKGISSMKKQYAKLKSCQGSPTCGDTAINWYWPIMYPKFVSYSLPASTVFNYRAKNVHLRLKYYMFRWDHAGAKQMHSKYVIVDDEHLVSGSYNLSLQSEQSCFENVMVMDKNKSIEQSNLIRQYVDNFDSLWNRNRNKINRVLDMIANGAEVWSKYPVSVSYNEVSTFFAARPKRSIRVWNKLNKAVKRQGITSRKTKRLLKRLN